MRPEFGADADNLVFSPQSNSGIRIAAHNIGQQILRWEKRVDLQRVDVTRIEDLEAVIDLDIRIKVTSQTEEIKIPMKKES
jgi:phage baseplate assembly protein W